MRNHEDAPAVCYAEHLEPRWPEVALPEAHGGCPGGVKTTLVANAPGLSLYSGGKDLDP